MLERLKGHVRKTGALYPILLFYSCLFGWVTLDTGGTFWSGFFGLWLFVGLFPLSRWFLENAKTLPTNYALEQFQAFRDRLKAHGLGADWEHSGAGHEVRITGVLDGLELSKETGIGAAGKVLKGADIELGDDTFDSLTLLRGSFRELEIISRLDAIQRRRLIQLLQPGGGSMAYPNYEWGVERLCGYLSRLPMARDLLERGIWRRTCALPRGHHNRKCFALRSPSGSPRNRRSY